MLVKDKKAIVTGEAREIGMEITKDFLNQGAPVYTIDLLDNEHMPSLQHLAKENQVEVCLKKADVSNEEEINGVLTEIIKEAGQIDILVNNAGITRDNLFLRISSGDWEKVIRINLTSAFLISKTVAKKMIKQKIDSIINMASIVGIGGNAGQINDSASKAGLIGLTKSLAKEIAAKNVWVNAIAPGYIETEMTGKLSPEAKAAMLGQVPMKHGGTPAEVASVAVFLASELSSYITARVIQVDGGMMI